MIIFKAISRVIYRELPKKYKDINELVQEKKKERKKDKTTPF